ncbi:hypothetical protein NMH_2232 [Neisseria meningitidis H44/76]|uniref:Uncharacterized protein n=2 Tax=Neisseria meningitidis TaxID=487 RepID=E6N052_NEIMH|nr:hypothetical protein HMPREF0602_0468 [Neisseria meningitidis ATCC 13091]EFV62840.1 hypothetical protein NMH_2232 [Neisseria meningitidis H44/76]
MRVSDGIGQQMPSETLILYGIHINNRKKIWMKRFLPIGR